MLEVSRLRRSAPDSNRFGLEVWRANTIGDDASVLPELVASGADVAIYRLPPSRSDPIKRLARMGMEVINAGMLVYYTQDLAHHEPRALANTDLVITLTAPDDDAELSCIVDASFDGYVSHYLANPLFDASHALAGYREWTLRHRMDPHRTASWIARRDGRIVGFACCEFDIANGVCNGGIYGVRPDHSRSGVFSDLIRFTQAWYKHRGFIEMRMSTKADNIAVQKVWGREGFHLYAAFDTLHVNALLSAGSDRAMERRMLPACDPDSGLRLTPTFLAMVREQFAPLHVEFSLLAELEVSNPDLCLEQRLSVRVPQLDRHDGMARAVALLRGPTGAPSMLGYASFRTMPGEA